MANLAAFLTVEYDRIDRLSTAQVIY